jgi:hypothetical protein
MAKNVQNSHFSFARIFILVEIMPLRSSPLHEAAERQAVKKPLFLIKTVLFYCHNPQIKAFNESSFLGC